MIQPLDIASGGWLAFHQTNQLLDIQVKYVVPDIRKMNPVEMEQLRY